MFRVILISASLHVMLGTVSFIASVFSLLVFHPMSIPFAAIDGILSVSAGWVALVYHNREREELLKISVPLSILAGFLCMLPFVLCYLHLPHAKCSPMFVILCLVFCVGFVQGSSSLALCIAGFSLSSTENSFGSHIRRLTSFLPSSSTLQQPWRKRAQTWRV